MDDNLVYLATYPLHPEAETIKGLLEANGVKCFLQLNENGDVLLGGFAVTEGPTEIWVPSSDLEKARNILDAQPISDDYH